MIQDNTAWKEYAKQRLEHTRELSHERDKVEQGTFLNLVDVAPAIVNKTPEYIDIEIANPFVKGVDRPYFYLNEEKIKSAERDGKWLRFTWQIQGMDASSVFSPAQWRKGAMPHEQVFKYADRKMKCLGNFLERE